MSHYLTELVRLLEQRHHPFPTDPAAITEQLRHTEQSLTEKLHHRAELIDRDHQLADRLHRHQRYWQMLMLAATALWAIFGFVSTYHLMQHSALNFFMLLLGVLGVNTVMLLIWLFNTLFCRAPKIHLPPLPFGRNDGVHHAMIQLYTEQSLRPHGIWRRNVLMHRLALTGLLGMFAAVLLMLLVKQYRFTWESTLLSNQTFSHIIAILAWLPEHLGFNVPHAAAVSASRNQLDMVNAAAWGSLLLGSLLCYGLIPRALAWAFSGWQSRRHLPQLDLNLPYYQNITQKWQRRIIDSDADYIPDRARPKSAPAHSSAPHQQYWAILVDTPHKNTQWYQDVLGLDWQDKGVISSRDEWANLAQQTAGQTLQLLVGIRAMQTPDRGTIRRLAALHAPITLWLWTDEDSESYRERLAQWHEQAQQYGWEWVDVEKLTER